MDRITHPFRPIYNEDSQILILGSFPSVKSREGEFFYHHPQNRFWKVISAVYRDQLPVSIEEKKELLLRNGVAVWDVIKSCEITGSSDNSIKNVIPNDLSEILKTANIKRIFANGSTAYQLYMRYIFPKVGRDIIKLPSTSPANAACNVDRLLEDWYYIRKIT
ncbi:MAG: mismatch-specific glycosylase [Herbinix sp.]|jgi:hypoxanthine-DNA glycosylase|nr:mismatch-specific glycosylase [Herbinix sp.]